MTAVPYESAVTVDSQISPGVSYVIDRMSFGRRVELMKAIREAAGKLDFHAAAQQPDTMQTSILSAEVDRLYVRWGVREVTGLEIDGEKATPGTLIAAGPEHLFLEALAAVKRQCGLNDEEKKT
jgi:hypothetical protein